MNASTLVHLCLLLHLTGLVLFGGLSFAYILAYKNFWKHFSEDRAKGIILINAININQKFRIIGALLLIITGIIMLLLTNGVYNKQIWMQIKLSLVVLLALTGPFLSRPPARKLKTIVLDSNQSGYSDQQMKALKKRINLAIITELTLLLSIVFLSVFKFN